MHELSVHHVSVLASRDVLVNNSHDGNHGQPSVVNLFVLVVDPSLIAVVNPVRGAKEVSRDVSRSLLDLLSEPLNGSTSEDELQPSDSGQLNGSLERIVAKSRVEGGVDASSVQVPAEAGRHGNASVLELGFAVEHHGGVVLAVRQAEGVEVAHRRCDADDLVLDPGIQLRGLGLLRDRGKGRAVVGGRVRQEVSLCELHDFFQADRSQRPPRTFTGFKTHADAAIEATMTDLMVDCR